MALQGFENFNTTRAVKTARARGMKFIVIDPRRTEMAEHASVFLQLRPGEDCTLIAGMLRIILAEGWHDSEFCDNHVQGLDALREAVDPFTADYVARRAGVEADDLYDAAALFARDSRKGIATTGTGPCMSPHSNVADHLVETLNVVCGRFLRSGDRVPNPGVLSAPRPFLAEVVPPGRHWENGPQSRIRGMGKINNELTAGTLADEILTPGAGQVKALIVVGGNPVNAVPDQHRTVTGLKALDCLISIEPYMTNTARLSHYVLPPVLFYERPGIANMTVEWETAICRKPFQQYSEPVSLPPEGADVMDDAVVLWELAKRLQLNIVLDGVPLDMTTPPTHEGMLELLTRNSRIPLSEVKRFPHGKVFELDVRVEPGRPDAGQFDVAPRDVVQELSEHFGPGHEHDREAPYPYKLVSRRMRDAMNSYGTTTEPIRRRHPFNPVFIHPEDLTRLGVRPGALVQIASDAGTVEAVAAADETMRPGVVSMTHSWGDRLPEEDGDPRVCGSSTSLLISVENNYEQINAMPRLSAIPVDIRLLTPAR
jgi:anaerobic selenocysteine-containing dehydrogenase